MTLKISIHALREEGDGTAAGPTSRALYFYPRPPRGWRPLPSLPYTAPLQFLSTPSARRATGRLKPLALGVFISIHALREEGDAFRYDKLEYLDEFLSTPSARRATVGGGDRVHEHKNFYPRPPRGGRLTPTGKTVYVELFLSTPSARRATAKTETKSLFSNKLYNILHEFRRALIYNGSKNYPNHAK